MSGKVGDNLYRASGVVAAAAGGGGLEWCSSIQSTAFCASAAAFCFLVNVKTTFSAFFT